MYMPVLKVKAGELAALKDSEAEMLTPLLELLPPKPSQDPLVNLKKRAKEIGMAWRHEIRVDVIGFVAAVGETLVDGGTTRHVLDILDTELKKYDVSLIPVTGIGRTISFQAAAAAVTAKNIRGASLRIQGIDLTQPGTLQGYALNAVKDLRLSPSDVDLVIDLQSVGAETIKGRGQTAINALDALYQVIPPKIAPSWRQAYVVSGGYPSNPSGVAPGSVTPLPRADWAFWTSTAFPVTTVYGDYGVDGPAFPATGGRAYSNIKYTIANEWLFIRGENITQPNGRPQFHTNCSILIKHPEFRGSKFSSGDAFFASTCKVGTTQGNPTNWRTAMYSHHIAFVVDQLRGMGCAAPTRHGPAAPPLVTKTKGRKIAGASVSKSTP